MVRVQTLVQGNLSFFLPRFCHHNFLLDDNKYLMSFHVDAHYYLLSNLLLAFAQDVKLR